MTKSFAQVRSLNGMVLIEPITEEAVTKSGIIIPEKTQKRKPKRGLVRKVDLHDKPVVSVGETVLYPHGFGTEIILKDESGDDKVFELLKETDLMMVI
jgi:co-chaperonin GroES (HSP10)